MLNVRTLSTAACLVLALVSLSAASQPYPSRPIRMIANGSPGGLLDIFGREFVAGLSARLGTPSDVVAFLRR